MISGYFRESCGAGGAVLSVNSPKPCRQPHPADVFAAEPFPVRFDQYRRGDSGQKNFRLRNTLTHLVRFSIPRFENRTYLLSGAGGEMQFFLLRKIRRRTGNTPRGPFVQTCIRPFTERAPPPPCRRLRRCQGRPARRKTRSREAGIAVFNTSSATEQREQVPPETISAGQMLPGKKLLSAKRRSR